MKVWYLLYSPSGCVSGDVEVKGIYSTFEKAMNKLKAQCSEEYLEELEDKYGEYSDKYISKIEDYFETYICEDVVQ